MAAVALVAGGAVALGAGSAQAATPNPVGVPSIALTAAGSNALTVAWGAATGVQKYRLSWSEVGSSNRWTSSAPDYQASDSPVTLTGLTAGKTYTVAVWPLNAAGQEVGEFAYATRATTPPTVTGVPAGVPSISLTPGGPSELKVTWGAATGAQHYVIGWNDATTYRQSWESAPDYTLSRRPVTLTGLLPGHSYTVYVHGVNAAGNGDEARAMLATVPSTSVTPPAPMAPITVTAGAPQTLTVAWTPSAGATRYRIGWYNVARSAWMSTYPDYTAGQSPVTLTGLTSGLPAGVSIYAYNDGGTAAPVSASGTPA